MINLEGCIIMACPECACRYNGRERTFEWQDGKLSTALKDGCWVLLDEINLAPPDVLESLAPMLQR